MRRLCIALLALVCLLVASCRPRPTFEPVEEKDIALDSERRILVQVEKESETFDKSGFLYEDKQLDEYLNGIAQKLLGAAKPDRTIVVRVVRDPVLNAYSYPNGRIYVNTGFLSAMDNEAQLANLLGHEMTHVLRRHAARQFTSMKKKSTVETGRNSLRTIVMASNFYSQSLEAEADREGLQRMAKAGYDPHESVRMFELLKQQADMEKIKVKLAYSDHPAIKERIKSTTEIVASDYPFQAGRTNAEEYRAATQRLLLDNAELDLKRANFVFAQRGIERYMTRTQKDPRAFFLLGELYREPGGQHSDEKARESYHRAIELKPAYAAAFRGLGLLEYRSGNKAAAKKNFERYLALKPSAADRDYIRQYIRASN